MKYRYGVARLGIGASLLLRESYQIGTKRHRSRLQYDSKRFHEHIFIRQEVGNNLKTFPPDQQGHLPIIPTLVTVAGATNNRVLVDTDRK